MNPISVFFLCMALLGLTDKFIGGRFHLSPAFDDGMKLIPEFLIYLMGIYCLGPAIVMAYQDSIVHATSGWFFDPSIISGSLLATDMGAYPISKALALDRNVGLYSGLCIGASLGTLISFCLPVYIAGSTREDGKLLTKGFIYGIVVLPITLITAGFMFGLPAAVLFKNLIVVIAVCILVLAGLFTVPELTSKALICLGTFVKIIAYISFVVVMFGLFFPEHAYLDEKTAKDGVVMIAKMGVNVAGALVTMELAQRIFKKQLRKLSEIMGMNEYSIMGLIIGMPAGVAMLPLLPRMDTRGKIINGAFAVSCHYMFGGQMALVASAEPSHLMVFFFVKLVGGILAILLALKMEGRKYDV